MITLEALGDYRLVVRCHDCGWSGPIRDVRDDDARAAFWSDRDRHTCGAAR